MSVSVVCDTDSEDELPSDWKEVFEDNQQIYYVNQTFNTRQREHPQSGVVKELPKNLPYGWVKKTCEKTNKAIYYNARQNRFSNIDPRLAFPILLHSTEEARVRYDSTTTPSQILQGLDLTGCHVIVTGANSGIGFETARSLANAGAMVIMACRDWLKGNQAAQSIVRENGGARVKVMQMDLAVLSSVHSLALLYKRLFRRLDVLVLNAAVLWGPRQHTLDGFEHTFQVNYLGHCMLVRELEGLLVRSAPARLVCLVPESHRFTDLNEQSICRSLLSPPDNNNNTNKHDNHPLMTYNLSKMCLAILSCELHTRLRGKGVSSVMVHPGNLVSSALYARCPIFIRLLHYASKPFAKTPEQAAAVVVYAAVAREMNGKSGVYVNNFLEIPASPHSLNLDTCLSLHILSSQMLHSALSLQPSSGIDLERDGFHHSIGGRDDYDIQHLMGGRDDNDLFELRSVEACE